MTQHGGGSRPTLKFAGPISRFMQQKTLLRQRCDARGFKSLLIEIIASQKVAPAFDPQKFSSVRMTGRAAS
jgi:hypothetical protein